MGGGWKSTDREQFHVENRNQDEENILTEEDVDTIFDIIEAEEEA